MAQRDNVGESGRKNSRKTWGAPTLKRYGRVQELTAGGTLQGMEKDGKFDMMGIWKPGKMP